MIGGNSIQLSRCCQEQKIFNVHSKAIHSNFESDLELVVVFSNFESDLELVVVFTCGQLKQGSPKIRGKLPIKMGGKKMSFGL